MSDAVLPIKTITQNDKRLLISSERLFSVYVGGQSNTFNIVTAEGYSNANANFSFKPSKNVVVDPRIIIKLPVTIDFTGSAPPGQNLIQSGFDAFRAYPIHSIMNTIQVTMDGNTVSMQMYNQIHELTRFNVEKNMYDRYYSTSPSMPDNSQEYAAVVSSNINPLAQNSTNPYVRPRGSFPYTVLTNTNTTAHIEADLVEELFISPFNTNMGDIPGLFGLENIDMIISWYPVLSRIWSHADQIGLIMNTPVVTLGKPTLYINTISPKEIVQLPKEVYYPYYKNILFQTDPGTSITAGSTDEITSQVINPSTVPSRVYVWVKKRDQDFTFKDTDSYFSIENIKVLWNNEDSLLSSASKQNLYNMSIAAGLQMSWVDWSGGPTYSNIGGVNNSYGTTGSVLCIQWGRDIGMKNQETVGQSSKNNLQITVGVKNVAATSIHPVLYISLVYDSTLLFTPGLVVQQTGVVSDADAVNAAIMPQVTDVVLDEAGSGGNIFSSLKNFGRQVLNVAKEVAPYVKTGIEVAKILGAGGCESNGTPGNIYGAGIAKKTRRRMTGGKRLMKQPMARRISYY